METSIVPIELAKKIEEVLPTMQGWCSLSKALKLSESIIAIEPEIVVEIGIFGGRSLIPMAMTLQHLGKGVIYGVEAWNPGAATSFTTNSENDNWWKEIDFSAIKSGFLKKVVECELASFARIVEIDAARAHSVFDVIDFLHIDGGHSAPAALLDVAHFLPKLRTGGILVFDDINWETTRIAVEVVETQCDTIEEVRDDDGIVTCKFYRKR